ncbi:MAG TPA: nuclear transport factor 2 family protein [Longimicrobiales bacterium]|nr:nuclear transport factor 2 family protein [Longimicrobiales bacterium]
MSATEVDAAVNQVRPQYIQTFGSGARAATGLPALYTADAVYSDSDGETHAGLAAIREAFADGVPPGASLRVSSFGSVGSGDLVVDMGAYTVDLPQANGAAVQENGRYMTAIQRMDDGTWKVVRHLAALSAPGTPAVPDTAIVRADTVGTRDTARTRDTTRTPDTTRIRMDTVPRP